MPTADATKLNAVNRMLTMVGSLRASSLSGTRADVLTAEQILDEVDREVQAHGWHFNRQYNQTFSPNAGNEIVLTEDIYDVTESSGKDTPRYRLSAQPDLAKRGTLLYNADDDTYTFTADVKLNVIRRVDFEDLPQYARTYVTARAARQFFEATRGARSPSAEENEARARAELMSRESINAGHNFFNNPDTIWAKQYRR